ncbi:MAG TPA: hypothetical protein VFX25_18240 [Streptosporangiaceae bacterium]|nr:hypothetical protein [Streptosporangiaceae bacterium]
MGSPLWRVSPGLARHAAAAQPGTRLLDPLGYAGVVLACAAVIVRRVAPLPVAGIVTAALVVFAARDYPGGPLLIPVMVALYTAGTAVERNVALTLGAAVGAVVAARAWLTAVHGNVSAFTWAAPGWVLAALAWAPPYGPGGSCWKPPGCAPSWPSRPAKPRLSSAPIRSGCA